MSEVERHCYCENCDSSARVLYDADMVTYEPEFCPFCGEPVGTVVDEFDEDFELLEDEDLLDGLEDDDNYSRN